MGSDADPKGLRHNRRHKKTNTAADYAGGVRGPSPNPEFKYLRRWGVDLTDPDVKDIIERLYGYGLDSQRIHGG
jgi:hypothetical protein